MKSVLASVVLGCLFLPHCNAQAISIIPSIDIQARLAPHNGTQEYGNYVVTNLGNIAITAMHFSFGCSSKVKQTPTFDTLVEYGAPTSRPITHLQTWTSNFSSTEILTCPGGIDAAIFADGHAEGDSQKILDLYAERSGIDKGIKFALPLLDKVIESESNQPEALVQIADTIQSVTQNVTIKIQERTGEWLVLSVVAGCLTREGEFSVPSDATKSRGASIQAVMKTENMNHARANAYVARRKLLEWQKDLEGNLTPQP